MKIQTAVQNRKNKVDDRRNFPMTYTNRNQLGNTHWSIADPLRGAMDADDFRDYMLSFLFLRYLSGTYDAAAKKELGKDYLDVGGETQKHEALKTHKKGLMQQLFPSPQEVEA